MPAPDLQTFVNELERRGLLKRVVASVDPILEITEIYDRVVKAGGPALLFENVQPAGAMGSGATAGPPCCMRVPVLINAFGTKERICLALGAESLDEIAARVKVLVKPEIPTTFLKSSKSCRNCWNWAACRHGSSNAAYARRLCTRMTRN